MPLRIALVRACVDELERSLNEPHCAQGVALQLADALDNLARALRLRDGQPSSARVYGRGVPLSPTPKLTGT
jgi:hypothetical protein